ncbi:hypothetical protein [Idiomarina sp. A28L]|uniref:hypothetical protein n=1 Tax=Idiomarina sp. A28L TaxID=1036674 RepID=UPI00111256E7|nr:hypothetical protein [Idiomarina sp. A28L]
MWNEQQRAAMAALGIPIYEFKGGDVSAEPEAVEPVAEKPSAREEPSAPSTEPSAQSKEPSAENKEPSAAEETQAPQPAHYRLGPWFLVFPNDIPAASFDWLRDLSSFIGGRPVQVSHVSADKVAIDCSAYAQNQLSPEQKQTLWAELKPALN